VLKHIAAIPATITVLRMRSPVPPYSTSWPPK
jgi:hypothetical protein